MRTLGLCLTLVALTMAGCKKPKAPPTTPATPAAEVVTGTAEPVQPNTNYQAGGNSNVLNAARRAQLLAQMHGLGTLIEVEYTLNNKMPQLNTITQSLDQATAAAVKEGRIVLCWTAKHDGLWAYEGGADTQGGVVLVSGIARRAEADEVKTLLGR